MRKILPVAVALAFFTISILAQSNDQDNCPAIGASGPPGSIRPPVTND